MLPSRIKIGRLDNGTRRYLELSIEKASTQVDFAPEQAKAEKPGWEDDEEDSDDWESADGSEASPGETAEQDEPSVANPLAGEIPAVFVPNGEGLTERGPLCRDGRR